MSVFAWQTRFWLEGRARIIVRELPFCFNNTDRARR